MKNKKFMIGIIIFIIGCLIVYIGGFLYINFKKNDGIIILAYHHFVPSKYKEEYFKDNYNVITTEKFEEQMKYLKENNYNSITPEDVLCYVNNECDLPNKSFIVTIDDGNVSTYYEALPILEKYHFNSLIFVISNRIGKGTISLQDIDFSSFYFLGQDKLDEIKKSYPLMTIGSHSDGLHDTINGQNPAVGKYYVDLLADVKLSKEKLYNAEYFAYPFGVKTDNYKKALKDAGYKLAFTFKDNRRATKNEDNFSVPRIEIRGDYSIEQFKNKLENKITLKEYTKKIIKKFLHIN